MQRLLLALLFIAFSSAAFAKGPDPRAAIVARIAADLAEAPVPVPPRTVRRAIKRTDLDGDAIPDYKLDWNDFASSAWCGTGGCRFQLWRGQADGAPMLVFDRLARDFKQRGAILDFDFHGSTCGGFGVEVCPASLGWDQAQKRLVERVTPGGDGVIRFVVPVAGMEGRPPAPVAARIAERKARCVAGGASTGEDADEVFVAVTVPDVDGDGARDWLLNGHYCSYEDERALVDLADELYVTAGQPDAPVLAASGETIHISVSTAPASVILVDLSDDCAAYSTHPDTRLCPRKSLRWDAQSRTFKPDA